MLLSLEHHVQALVAQIQLVVKIDSKPSDVVELFGWLLCIGRASTQQCQSQNG